MVVMWNGIKEENILLMLFLRYWYFGFYNSESSLYCSYFAIRSSQIHTLTSMNEFVTFRFWNPSWKMPWWIGNRNGYKLFFFSYWLFLSVKFEKIPEKKWRPVFHHMVLCSVLLHLSGLFLLQVQKANSNSLVRRSFCRFMNWKVHRIKL